MSPSPADSRQRLVAATRLHAVHWGILLLSVALTVGVYRAADRAAHERMSLRFEAEVDRIGALIVERLTIYEQGLWGGVSLLRTLDGEVDRPTWAAYAATLALPQRYPGVDGIGVIHPVPREREPEYLAAMRVHQPDFRIHPAHDRDEKLPISYIEPNATNARAVGLDIAHERHRYEAATAARGSGEAQITGPIVLVQDSEQTPGFLFFAPQYRGAPETNAERHDALEALVYAPFVVKRLLDGALARERRHVLLQLRDGEDVLYDELADAADRDPTPVATRRQELPLYGRTWTLQVEATRGFEASSGLSAPRWVLAAGLGIDGLLLWFFLALVGANRAALQMADDVSRDLATANEELLQFNYRTSHDLVAPLRTIQGYLELARADLAEGDPGAATAWFEPIAEQAERLVRLVGSLLDLSRADRVADDRQTVALPQLVADVVDSLEAPARARGVAVSIDCGEVGAVVTEAARLRQVVQNLVANGIQHAGREGMAPWVEVVARQDDKGLILEVLDNGPEVPPEVAERAFELFFRGQSSVDGGSGIGLYLVRKHMEKLGGTAELVGGPAGTTARITLPGGEPT